MIHILFFSESRLEFAEICLGVFRHKGVPVEDGASF